MKITIDIPDATLADAIHHTGATRRREAVGKALEEFNRQQKVNDLIANFGTLDFAGNEEIGRRFRKLHAPSSLQRADKFLEGQSRLIEETAKGSRFDRLVHRNDDDAPLFPHHMM